MIIRDSCQGARSRAAWRYIVKKVELAGSLDDKISLDKLSHKLPKHEVPKAAEQNQEIFADFSFDALTSR